MMKLELVGSGNAVATAIGITKVAATVLIRVLVQVNVCLRKPVGMVTMTDVIEETGLSQGGIYRFYNNLTFEDVTYKICDIMADVMEKHLLDIQKINFDITVLAINEPDRAKAIISGAKGSGNFEYLASVTMPMLVEACMKNKLKPVTDSEDILKYISASYTGIEMNCILSACYGDKVKNMDCKPKEMFDVLAKTIILLFGGNVK